MKKLQVGFLKTKELAEWMGITYASFRNRGAKHLEELKNYCEFEKVYGGVNIKEVFIEEYDRKLYSTDKKLYLDEIKRCTKEQDGLATLSGMSRKFLDEQKVKQVKEKTLTRRLSKIGDDLFGKTKDLLSKGPEGTREYIWAIKIDDFNTYRLMTEEEEKLFDDIISSFYKSKPDKIKERALLDKKYFTTENMTKEQYQYEIEKLDLDLFSKCIAYFRDKTGETVVRCTMHQLFHSMEFEENENQSAE